MLVLSHSDSDHIAAVPDIFEKYTVKTIIWGGLERQTKTWGKVNQAIKTAKESGSTEVINLKYDTLRYGSTWILGETKVTYVAGFYAPPDSWGFTNKTSGEFRNAGSIVMRLSYKKKSILFTGDAVGRHLGDPPGTLIATEKFMVDNSDAIKIDSDILIAPHHGADNGNSESFIRVVNPEYVIFSAGHKHRHPRQIAAKRYLEYGIDLSNMFRTDLHDDEGDDEWDYERVSNHSDKKGDDDIDILIKGNGEIAVEYAGN